MAWRRKKKAPKKPLVLHPAPEPAGDGEVGVAVAVLSPEEDLQVRQLEDRRTMEAREELQRIRSMGRVEALKKRLDAKLGRNLYRKLNTGPLGKKHKSSVFRSGSMKVRNLTRSGYRGGVRHKNYHRRVSSDSGVVESEGDAYVGFTAQPSRVERRLEQIQELAAIKEMGIVRSSTDGNSQVNSHLNNHIARMTNHRLMIKPQGRRGSERKKSSVLVTSMGDPEERARQLYREQSRVVIEGFMQAPSHKQRVLEKLSSSQLKRISDSLKMRKTSSHLETQESDESPRFSPIPPIPPPPASANQQPPSPPPPPPISPSLMPPGAPPQKSASAPPIHGPTHSEVTPPLLIPTAIPTSSLDSSDTMTNDIEGDYVGTREGDAMVIEYGGVFSGGHVIDDGRQVVRGVVSDGGDMFGDRGDDRWVFSRGVVSDGGGVVSDGGGAGSDDGGVVGSGRDVAGEGGMASSVGGVAGSDEKEGVSGRGEMLGSGGGISDDESDGDEVGDYEHSLTSARLAFGGIRGIPPENAGLMMGYDAVVLPEEVGHVLGRGSIMEVEYSLSHDAVMKMKRHEQLERDEQRENEEERTVLDDPEYLDNNVVPSTSSLTSDSHSSLHIPPAAPHYPLPAASNSESSSALSSQVSWASESSPLVQSKRYTSPQLSLSLSGGDLAAHFVQPSLSLHPTSHGHYSTVEVDVDPFAAEFEAGLNHGSIMSTAADGPSTSHASLLPDSDYLTPHPRPGYKKEIPRKAFQDPRFLAYIRTLDHEPEVQDYITFKMAMIGDLIEEQYAEKLNQALDEVFVELVKQEFVSFATFKHVSKRLLLQGRKIQDGIFLIPTFARQLLDFVPQLGGTIEHYTHMVLDTYASDNILGMGGWNSLMESYGEDDTFNEQCPYDADDHNLVDAGVVNSSPWHGAVPSSPGLATMTPGSAATLPVRRNSRKQNSQSETEPETEPYPSQDFPSPQRFPVKTRPFPLRRCVSVEVLLGEDVSANPSPVHPAPAPSFYSRSVSINSLNLATPTTPSSITFAHLRNCYATDSATPVTPGPTLGFVGVSCLGTLPEESRVSSRRSSVCSVVVLSGYNDENGFELVGMEMSGSRVRVHRSTESLTASGEYMDHLYSNRDNGTGGATPPSERATPPTVEHATPSSEPDREKKTRERRRSSVVGVLLPMTTLTAHVVAIGCMYFSS